MGKIDLEIFEDKFLKKYTAQYELSILLGVDSLCYAVSDSSGNLLGLRKYSYSHIPYSFRDLPEAAKDFEAHLEKHPEDAYAHYNAGLAYNRMKRPDKVLTHFEMFVKMRPDAPEARKVRAVLQSVR